MAKSYTADAPIRETIDQTSGPLVVEFGTGWCGHCQAAQPLIAEAFKEHQSEHPSVRHLKIEDGKGRRLGRTFGVKLWPTLIFMHDGKEMMRLVRPGTSEEITRALLQIKSP
ncbi:thioredoxin family protein [Marinobacter fonticola]|uniref:thioredoxin family protein n=1 Tax=Marinobacter fonticola TaxID=2603215 RepID=UPI001D0D8159|nr:thioredoxin family protein [Marinobacter fonticola]